MTFDRAFKLLHLSFVCVQRYSLIQRLLTLSIQLFKFNYGHLFMWFDQLGGTYRDPKLFAPKLFRENV
jgi:hypothetical protein